MDSSQASEKLIGEADACLRKLQSLLEIAEKASVTHRSSQTTTLLSNVGQIAKNSSRSLQNWKKDINHGTIIDEQHWVKSTIGHLNALQDSIDGAKKALEARLRYRKAFLIGWIRSIR